MRVQRIFRRWLIATCVMGWAFASAAWADEPPTDVAETEPPVNAPAESQSDSQIGPNDLLLLAVFSSEGSPKVPNVTHNWGVALRVERNDDERRIAATHTISWMPETLNIPTLRIWNMRGVNLTCEQSFAHAVRTGQRITLWGVYEIDVETYEKFLRQHARINSGRFGYQCLDTIGEAGRYRNGMNCIHAFADFANLMPRPNVARQPYGDESAALIAQRLLLRGHVVDLNADHTWVVEEAKWNRWSIARRRYVVPEGAAETILARRRKANESRDATTAVATNTASPTSDAMANDEAVTTESSNAEPTGTTASSVSSTTTDGDVREVDAEEPVEESIDESATESTDEPAVEPADIVVKNRAN